jgi:hypothetical protein
MIDEFGTLDLRGVVEIKEREYRDNKQIKKIIIGNTVERIGNYAFVNCSNVEEIEFEEGCKLKEISKYCFNSCNKIKKIELLESIEIIKECAFNACRIETIILKGVKIIEGGNFFKYCVKEFYISNSIEKIDNGAFYSFHDNKNPNVKIYIKPKFHEQMLEIFPNVEFVEDCLNHEYILK